ncbi:lysine--tRNA ligase [Shewanella loihica]|uniref:Lysine--tRNA ligase n=1 Tax=Shewanella loihica (strain ATCC BAA-1088 / PV-4) TaxID=323850 RepID=SYK_SHELP|nr:MULTISPECIES: lysine--tRNA ligase [Shewanella]A3QB36.1 RecName: Full=Lysine--tRNA ligase; AltName: Full=Lysyl-tRNA synthetase; Short=LysRS [Shewanella loihica PV-4]ABO22684.1 lysyl-tRNA synthetase [Shewanella loihica PV-4]QYJ83220.1 lysine--tRNA ligase [Shewanella aegiceratis]QYJ94587.1 lysine--tRNA ligase [Shewanella spartinae]QYJ98439.1 lysine--tRNA ligase [Shewanella alkalitolerans]
MTEQTQDENKLIAERRAKLDHVRASCPANGHPNNFDRKHKAADIQAEYGQYSKEELEEMNVQRSIAGRIMAKRGPFLVIQDVSGRIQAYAGKDVQKDLKAKYQGLDIGDIIGVTGQLHLSGKGDLYVNMEEYQLLTKALRPLPEKFHGLTDQETRYRQRYVDLIVNEESRAAFIMRSKVVTAIRNFMVSKEFMEVETPMMHSIPGGASARPFITHHNALDIEMYLRIAPELYLKRLVVGGFERVFEINRNFRNEGLSPRHNPEFTMMEFYMAYADYKDLMDLTEEMLSSIAKDLLGDTKLPYGEHTIDFGGPYERLSMLDAIKKYNPDNETIQSMTYEEVKDVEFMRNLAKSLGMTIEKFWTCGQLLEEIFGETAEPKLMQPTFITGYPADISPLARRNDENHFITDRFEFFIGGREVANGFSELNDAEDQDKRFKAQVDAKDAGDDEAMFYDADYITALEHGLPPTAGQGIGIDRLVMLFTNTHTIRDVILFPAMRPQG